MLRFLTVFFCVYGAMHWYAFRKLAAVAGRGAGWSKARALVVAFMVLMVVAPLLVRLAEKAAQPGVAVVFAYLGYVWMGFLFLFVVSAGLVDLLRGGWWLGCRLAGRPIAAGWFSSTWTFWVAFPLALLLCAYGWREAAAVRLERVVVPTAKLPATVQSFRIVLVSDVHLGVIVRQARLARILALVQAAEPDLLVSTGDLVDGQSDDIAGLASMLAAVEPRYGKYAVTGNHEYYVGLEPALAFTRAAGFTVLQGEGVAVTDFLTLAGVDDPTSAAPGSGKEVQEETLLAELAPQAFKLLLKHRPELAPAAGGIVDLQLSGHVHQGQIFPFNCITWLAYPVRAGMNAMAGTALLYVSRGSGTWGPPIRLLAPPEVTLIELVPHRSGLPLSG